MKEIVWDLETTGLDYNIDKIVQYTFMDCNSGETISSYVNPLHPMTLEASKITGITDSKLQDKQPFSTHAQSILDFIFQNKNKNKNNNSKDTIYLIAHNGDRFDKLFLLKEFQRIQLHFPLQDIRFIDTLKVSRIVFKNTLKKFDMGTLRKKYGLDDTNSHCSNKDVLDLSIIYKNLKESHSKEKMYDISINTCCFGKYKNMDFRSIPTSYLDYLQNKNTHLYHEDLLNYFIRTKKIS